jgi:hypothetical protein
MENNTMLTRGQIRSAIEDPAASPQSRLNAANLLLDTFGLSDRHRRLAKKTAKRFAKYVSASSRSQQQVRWQSEKLLARIERALEAGSAQPEDTIEDNDSVSLEEQQPSATSPKSIVGNTELLPPDADDDYWDFLIGGRSRRQLFLMLWGLDPALSRSEIIAAVSDPARIKAHTLELKLWSRTREQLDAKFKEDNALITEALAERGLDDHDDLVKEIIASGFPLYEFTRGRDLNGDGLPVLVRSKAGDLIRAIEFTQSWRLKRAKFQPL